jgi:hypothetical protein
MSKLAALLLQHHEGVKGVLRYLRGADWAIEGLGSVAAAAGPAAAVSVLLIAERRFTPGSIQVAILA